jgi:hypothetical protein
LERDVAHASIRIRLLFVGEKLLVYILDVLVKLDFGNTLEVTVEGLRLARIAQPVLVVCWHAILRPVKAQWVLNIRDVPLGEAPGANHKFATCI